MLNDAQLQKQKLINASQSVPVVRMQQFDTLNHIGLDEQQRRHEKFSFYFDGTLFESWPEHT
jgi:hypothetical protein